MPTDRIELRKKPSDASSMLRADAARLFAEALRAVGMPIAAAGIAASSKRVVELVSVIEVFARGSRDTRDFKTARQAGELAANRHLEHAGLGAALQAAGEPAHPFVAAAVTAMIAALDTRDLVGTTRQRFTNLEILLSAGLGKATLDYLLDRLDRRLRP